nr:MAG TPA: deoxycytidylate deaminase [Caudoviricetes sp.]
MTKFDLNMYFILNTVKMLSTCKDKQVAAISVYDDNIIGLSWNKPITCNSLCNHTCTVTHAEQSLNIVEGCTVYLNLFPCEGCQRYMSDHGVKHVIVFGKQHKPIVQGLLFDITLYPDIVKYLPVFNGKGKQRIIEAGECGELITAIADSTRTDREEGTRDIVAEEVDVMLQLMINSTPEFAGMFRDKVEKLTNKFLPPSDEEEIV